MQTQESSKHSRKSNAAGTAQQTKHTRGSAAEGEILVPDKDGVGSHAVRMGQCYIGLVSAQHHHQHTPGISSPQPPQTSDLLLATSTIQSLWRMSVNIHVAARRRTVVWEVSRSRISSTVPCCHACSHCPLAPNRPSYLLILPPQHLSQVWPQHHEAVAGKALGLSPAVGCWRLHLGGVSCAEAFAAGAHSTAGRAVRMQLGKAVQPAVPIQQAPASMRYSCCVTGRNS